MSEKSPQELYAERVKPVSWPLAALSQWRTGFPSSAPSRSIPITFAGVTFIDRPWRTTRSPAEACHKFLDYFQPDIDFGPIFAYPAQGHGPDIGHGSRSNGPGHGLADNVMYQYQGRRVHDGR